MDPMERFRRWKRSLDGFISFRKAVLIAFVVLVVFLYIGPTFFSWLFGRSALSTEPWMQSCSSEKLFAFQSDLAVYNAHVKHNSEEESEDGDRDYLAYVGNGHIGLSVEPSEPSELHIFGYRHLNVPVPFQPVVHLTPDEDVGLSDSQSESVTLVHYTQGFVQTSQCFKSYYSSRAGEVSLTNLFLAHRAIPNVLVQEIKLSNPTAKAARFNLQRPGITNWSQAVSKSKTIEHGDGGQQYTVIAGLVPVPPPATASGIPPKEDDMMKLVVIVAKKLPSSTIEIRPRSSDTITLFTSVAYSDTMKKEDMSQDILKKELTTEAINALLKATSMTSLSLHQLHMDAWSSLWTTGFGISHSKAEAAINGYQINATMYYVLSQVPAPLHSVTSSSQQRDEYISQLAYSEGCYSGTPTLTATTLWRSLSTLDDVNALVKTWILSLEKNGCNKLVRAGADGVAQAMVLSYAGLKFREDHLELNSHPKDLHRDYHIRRVSYGNATHLNISVIVQDDNKAVLLVALDRRNKDYFACDAGCLDPSVKLSTEYKLFPVKLTDPLTAILYITSDHQHMEELKHAIHFKEVVEAPAHEHHVIALHKHGNKLGGLPTIFWFSIGFLIFVFHLFLGKLIWQEYCAGGTVADKFRARKYSDYQ